MITQNISGSDSLFSPVDRGFTLIELIIALAVGAILLSIAVPGLTQLINGNRSTAYVNSLVGAIHLARSEAIKRNSAVVVCASSTGLSCVGNWSQGWVVLDNDNPAGNPIGSGAQSVNGLNVNALDGVLALVFDGEGIPDRGLDLSVGMNGITPRQLQVSLAGSVRSGITGR